MALQRRMRSLPISNVQVTDPFWSRWQRVISENSLPAQWEQIVQTGRLDNFKRAAAGENGEFKGYCFNDSDVYKWAEACAYSLATHPNQGLQSMLDEAISAIEAAQEDDGYLNTYFQIKHPEFKWRNLSMMHEMYCAGHLFEAGVALAQNLGDQRLLQVSLRLADHIMGIFGPGKRRGYPGHQEIELGLIKLADVTGEQKYADFARWLVEERGKRPSRFEAELEDSEAMSLSPYAPSLLKHKGEYRGDYAQDHAPIRQHSEVVGHAVRAMYFYIAAAELAEGEGDAQLERALERTWSNLTRKRMYVTGGIGPSSSNEGFTGDYDLPNLTAYAETCAAIGLVFWGHKMLELTANSEYADILERSLYNGTLSGISLDGRGYFYTNPLESRGSHERTPWFECACCPPNIARLIGALGRYAFGAAEDGLYIHLPIGAAINFLVKGVEVQVVIESEYPWSGSFKVRVEPDKPVEFSLRLRIPDWADDVSTELPGLTREAEYEAGYASFTKEWKKGDTLTVDLDMHPKWVEADPRVRDDLGRVCLTRGPLVYALEERDFGAAPQLFSADTEAEITVDRRAILEGITTLMVDGLKEREDFPDQLYAELGSVETDEARAEFIPFYSWCNRGPNQMQVWVRRI